MFLPLPGRSFREATTVATLAPFVIAGRLTEMWLGSGSPNPSHAREATLMVTEKLSAAAESMIAMNLAAMRLGFAASFGLMQAGLRSGLAGRVDGVVAAGLRPYSRRVAANHRRLSQRDGGG
jgi:hypothetical protein